MRPCELYTVARNWLQKNSTLVDGQVKINNTATWRRKTWLCMITLSVVDLTLVVEKGAPKKIRYMQLKYEEAEDQCTKIVADVQYNARLSEVLAMYEHSDDGDEERESHVDPYDHNGSDHDAVCAEEAVVGDDPVCADECLVVQSDCTDPGELEHAPGDSLGGPRNASKS